MNLVALLGFILCFGMILSAVATNGGLGGVLQFLHLPSMLVTFGGSFCALMITADTMSDYLDGLRGFGVAFKKVKVSVDDISRQILEIADLARKDGLLALEEYGDQIEDEFMKKAVSLIVDGTEPELVKDILENDMIHKVERNKKQVKFWEDLGSYGPAWGMLGTLIGLINMMKNMGTDASAIGSGMSLALITTLYGSLLANWICIPLARKLDKSSAAQELAMELMIEGVLSIQAGENPHIIREKLRSFREGSKEVIEEEAA